MGEPPVTFGQEGDILGSTELARLRAYVEGNLDALRKDRDLHSNAVMLHNAMLNLISYLETTNGREPEQSP